MSRPHTRRAVLTGVRIVMGAAVAVGAVLAVQAGVAAPWPQISEKPAQIEAVPAAGDTVLTCTGAFRALGRDSQDASAIASAGNARLAEGGDADRSALAVSGVGGAEESPMLTGAADGGQPAAIAAAESLTLEVEDLAGFAAAACPEPAADSWIIGGSTRTGAADVLVLSNPGSVAATVTLTVYGANPSTSQVVIPAKTQRSMSFAGVAGGNDVPVVRVTSEGAPVAAALQSSLMDVLDPAGIDVHSATRALSNELVFAGVQVASVNDQAATTVLRLLAPDEDTLAQVAVTDADGTVSTFDVLLTEATPVAVDLGVGAIGRYRVDVTASTPVTGGIWQTTGTGAGSDFAWLTPAPAIAEAAMFAVPGGPKPQLHLLATEDTEVVLTGEAGAQRTITVEAGVPLATSVRSGGVYTLQTDGTVHGAVTMQDDGRMAGWPVPAALEPPTAITVYH